MERKVYFCNLERCLPTTVWYVGLLLYSSIRKVDGPMKPLIDNERQDAGRSYCGYYTSAFVALLNHNREQNKGPGEGIPVRHGQKFLITLKTVKGAFAEVQAQINKSGRVKRW